MEIKKVLIKDIMREIQIIEDKATFKDALKKMICKKTNSLVVVDNGGKFVGVINAGTLINNSVPNYIGDDMTAAHFANESLFKEQVEKVADKSVKELIVVDIKTIKERESLLKAAMIVASSRQIRIPVLDDNGKPLGLLTRTELKQVIGAFLEIEGCFKG